MPELKRETIEPYLSSLMKTPVKVCRLTPLGKTAADTEEKGYGYGTPVRIDYMLPGGECKSAVLHTMHPGSFGHEHMADRAQTLLWEHHAFNHLPRHIRSLDAGGVTKMGELISLGQIDEVCTLTEYAEGQGYFLDLERLRDTGALGNLDLVRTDALCDYLAGIHAKPGWNPELYVRRIRELIGHGECIFGLIDSYPPHATLTPRVLEEIEQLCVRWRWKLKGRTHRLRQVHGDFHPWNILFQSGVEFQVLDRSRGEYGDAADDVACLSMNYLFFSLQRNGELTGVFETMYRRFWDRYLTTTGDREILDVVAPFLVFRGLVMANPVWYPNLNEIVRGRLLAFMLAVLREDSFDPCKVNTYCGV